MAQHKNKKVYRVDVTKNIVESSSTPETKEQRKRRENHATQMARRRATGEQKKDDIKENQKYDLMALYHQLNYNAIKDKISSLNIKPSIINNSYLFITNLDYETSNKVKDALLECHYETKMRKQYKVRITTYKHLEKDIIHKRERKPSNNNVEIVSKAKAERKNRKKECFKSRKPHTSGRKEKKVSHQPGVLDTSKILKKITLRAKKACAYLEKKEREAKRQLHHLANIKEKHSKKPIQKTINFPKS